jgi:hypothetical protein
MSTDQPLDMEMELDRLLAVWAGRHHLTDERAEEMRQAILGAPPALDSTWWRSFNAQMASTIARAAAIPQPAQAALRQALRPPRLQLT